MSGAEAAVGLFLGVLPLVISAIEHYDDALRPFTNYRNFTSRAQRVYDELETERTIFRTECQLLLSTVAARDVVSKMLNNSDHPSWKDQVLCQRFGRQLGSLGAACSSTVSEIKRNLEEIGKKSEEFSAVILLPKEGIKFGDRVWRHRVGKKLKFAFSESGLQESIASLRRLNKTFLTIANQIVRLDGQSSSSIVDYQRDKCTNKTSQEVEKFRMVQQASRQLYEALSRACRVHARHLALLCVEAIYSSNGGGSERPEIQFKLSFKHNYPTIDLDPLLHVQQNTTKEEPLSLSRRKASKSEGRSRPEGDLTLQDHYEKTPTFSLCNLSWFEVQTIISDKMISNQNLHVSKIASQTRNFLGILDETESCRHLIYGPSTSIPTLPNKKSISLMQLIAQESNKGPIGGMPQYQRLHIAKLLALTVLQFHATPWLGERWQSKDIVFHSITKMEPEQPETPSPPHLNALIMPKIPRNSSTRESDTPQSFLSMTGIAPNALLFSLGVMLLEIAYGAPFKSLQQPEEAAASPDSRLAEFITARRLADGVGYLSGPRLLQL